MVTPCGVDPDELAAVERAIAEEDRKLDKLLELYYADAITVSELKQRRAASEDLSRRLRERHDELVSRDVDPAEVSTTAREAIRLLSGDEVSAEAKNDFLRRVVERVEYYREDRPGGRIRLVVRLRGLG